MRWLLSNPYLAGSITIVILLTAMYVQYLRSTNETLRNDISICKSNYEQMTKVRETERAGSSILQSENARLKSDRARLKRLYDDCQPVPIAPARDSGTPTGTILSSKNGVAAGSLFDLAADCDYIAGQLKACQAICK